MRYRTWSMWAAGVVVLLAGCASTKQAQMQPQTARPVASMESTRLALVRAEQQVDATLAAMDRLASQPGNVPQAYAVFSTEVSQTDAQARQATLRSQQMRNQWRQYIAAWEQEIDQLSTPQLKERATQRHLAVTENYDRLRDAAREMQAAYQPFLTQLQDIQKTLSLDTTPAGVQTVEPAFKVARESGENLKKKINSFITDIDEVTASGQTQVGSAAGAETQVGSAAGQ